MRILVAEDDATSLVILRRAVERLGHECVAARDGDDAWNLFCKEQPDVIITDWMMPGLDGPELVARVREDSRYCYVVMLTALTSEDDAMTGMSAGADGFLTKPLDLPQLRLALVAAERMTALHRKLAEREAELETLNSALARESRIDPLTGLGNRLRMQEDLDALDDSHQRYGRPYALALLDIDHFKRFNDRYGHPAGDDALQRVAGTLRAQLRTVDDVYRYGGEELLVILYEQTLETAHDVLQRLRAAVAGLGLVHAGNAPSGVVTVSAGVAAAGPGARIEVRAVLRAADKALYVAKSAGRDRVAVEPLAPAVVA
jgi:two-component system chemotaxis response regulator CheY